MNDDHVPVPAGHAPRLEAGTDKYGGLVIVERESGATLRCDNPVEVRQ